MLPVPEGTVFHNSPERAPWLLGGEGSNLQPPDSESGALPVELPPIGRTANLADPGPPRDGVPPRIGGPRIGRPATGPVPPEFGGRLHHYDRPVDTQRVVVVGGGVLGTMHALEACRRGWEVVHLEADAGPRRASVRNFGLVWVSGRAAGPELDLAVRARALWEQIAGDSPDVGFRPDGSLTVARHPRGAGPDGRGGGPTRCRCARVRAPGPRRCPCGQPGGPGRGDRRPPLPTGRGGRAGTRARRAAHDPRGHRSLHLAPPSPGGRCRDRCRRHRGGRGPPGPPPRGLGRRPVHRRPALRSRGARWVPTCRPPRCVGAGCRCCRPPPMASA